MKALIVITADYPGHDRYCLAPENMEADDAADLVDTTIVAFKEKGEWEFLDVEEALSKLGFTFPCTAHTEELI